MRPMAYKIRELHILLTRGTIISRNPDFYHSYHEIIIFMLTPQPFAARKNVNFPRATVKYMKNIAFTQQFINLYIIEQKTI